MDLETGGGRGFQQGRHLFHSISLTYRGRRVVACDPASIDRGARIGDREMHRVADEIIDEHRMAADAQGFGDERGDLFWRKMMDEQATTHNVESIISKGKRENIGRHPMPRGSVAHMRNSAIKKRYVESQIAGRDLLLNAVRHIPGSRSHV